MTVVDARADASQSGLSWPAVPFLAEIEARYCGTGWDEQELDGELLDRGGGALWSTMFWKVLPWVEAVPGVDRMVVAWTRPVTTGSKGGILSGFVAGGVVMKGERKIGAPMVAGELDRCRGHRLHGMVGKAAVALGQGWLGADRVVAEVNQRRGFGHGHCFAAVEPVAASDPTVRPTKARRGGGSLGRVYTRAKGR